MSKLNVISISSIILGDPSNAVNRLRALFKKLDTDYLTNNRVSSSFETCVSLELSQSDTYAARFYRCISVAVDSFMGDHDLAVNNLNKLFQKLDKDYGTTTVDHFEGCMDLEILVYETQEAKLCRSISATLAEFGV